MEQSGRYATIASLGSDNIDIGDYANCGALIGGHDVFLHSYSHVHGTIRNGGNVTTHTGVIVDGAVSSHQTIPAHALTRSAHFATVQPGINLGQNQQLSAPVAPGAYDSLDLAGGAEAVLTTGDYYFSTLELHSDSSVVIDDSAGPVFVYVKQSVVFRGRITQKAGGYPDWVLSYLGCTDPIISAPFRGTIVAPSSTVKLELPGAGDAWDHHEGSFFAKHVRVDSDTKVVHHDFPWFIRAISASKKSVCENESMSVSVDARGSANPAEQIDVTINGIRSTTAYLQFSGLAGPRWITVTAANQQGRVDTKSVMIQLVDCGNAPIAPAFSYQPNAYHPNTVQFNVFNAAKLGSSPTYDWTFGDGQTKSTIDAIVDHDYTSSLARDAETALFTVTLTVHQAGVADRIARRTVPVGNLYAINKNRGYIVPPTQADDNLTIQGDNWTGSYTITNLEDDVVTLSRRQVEYHYCDPGRRPLRAVWEAQSVPIAAKSSGTFTLTVPKSAVGSDVCSLGVHWIGQSPAQLAVNAHAYFAVPGARHAVPVIDDAFNAALTKLINNNELRDPDNVTDEEIRQLVRRGKLPMPHFTEMTFLEPQVGQICNKGDTSPDPSKACLPATIIKANGEVEYRQQITGAFLANAWKGDVVLSSSNSEVGKMLTALTKKQYYSHSGIMTDHGVHIRNNTATPNRIADTAYQPGFIHAGFVHEGALKYGWPGTVTQSIRDAYMGEQFNDYETFRDLGGNNKGTAYSETTFERINNDAYADVLPIVQGVLRPVLGSANEGMIRELLEGVADTAVGMNEHYRFYAFTDASVADRDGAPALDEAGQSWWGAGTHGSVCSTFIWHALKKYEQLHGHIDLQDAPPRPGEDSARISGNGLYKYTAEERAAAAHALFDIVFNRAYEKAGWLGEAATDASDKTANQFVSCFASDNCTPEDNDGWKNPGVGTTVSPSDLMNWHLFGAVEQIRLLSGQIGRVYEWTNAPGYSTIHVVVKRAKTPGAPLEIVPGARVNVNGVKEGFTDQQGSVSFDGVPQGAASVSAEIKDYSYEYGYQAWTGEVTETVGLTTTEFVVELKLPEGRSVDFRSYIEYVHHEYWPSGGPWSAWCGLVGGTCEIDPIARDCNYVAPAAPYCLTNEDGGAAVIACHAHLDDVDNVTVNIDCVFDFYDTGEKQTSYGWSFRVAPGETVRWGPGPGPGQIPRLKYDHCIGNSCNDYADFGELIVTSRPHS